jgi:hypothetical protein
VFGFPRRLAAALLPCLLAIALPATAAHADPQHGDLVISELRFSGPDGTHDRYVEVTNDTSVGQSTRGLALTFETTTGTKSYTLPRDTLAPGASLLYADAAYSLSTVATPDRTVALDGDLLGVKLTSNIGVNVLDRVGTKAASPAYRQGSGLPTTTTSPQAAWVHQIRAGRFTDKRPRGLPAAQRRPLSGDRRRHGRPRRPWATRAHRCHAQQRVDPAQRAGRLGGP